MSTDVDNVLQTLSFSYHFKDLFPGLFEKIKFFTVKNEMRFIFKIKDPETMIGFVNHAEIPDLGIQMKGYIANIRDILDPAFDGGVGNSYVVEMQLQRKVNADDNVQMFKKGVF